MKIHLLPFVGGSTLSGQSTKKISLYGFHPEKNLQKNTVFPHIVSEETIWGKNYSREENIQEQKLYEEIQ